MMLTWEYPPLSYGGLARHVQDLSEALVSKGHSLHIITQGDNNIPEKDEVNGVKIYRTRRVKIGGSNFVDDILHLNFQLLERAIEVQQGLGKIDLVHAHDWLVFWAGKVLKHSFKKPLIYTIHATEYGRNQGIYNETQRYINDLEWYACYEAWRVIVCSDYMKNEVRGLFQVPKDKLGMIANGVNIDNYQAEASEDFRSKYANPEEKIVFFVGRIVREKGIQVLLRAVPEILEQDQQVKFVVAGKGPFLSSLRDHAAFLGISEKVYFTGFISDEERNKLYHTADLAVFPSLYEPFGIVALEAMATKIPVITSSAGGLDEFVKDGKNGLKVKPDNPQELVDSILYLLNNQSKSREMAETAYQFVKNYYNWDKIADKTEQLYIEVLNEYKESNWNKKNEDQNINNEKKNYAYRYML
jgi:glycogen(starch) synthase